MSQMMHTCILRNICIVDAQDQHSGNTRSGICRKHKIRIPETHDLGPVFWKHMMWDLYSGNTRSEFRKLKICILETQDPYSGYTRILILVCSQDEDLMDHTSQEWLNGVHLFILHKKCFYEHL